VQLGQAAEVRIDAHPNKLLRGHGEQPGRRLSLRPAPPRDTQGLNLVPGLSATVSVPRP
jgi:hypothetical protein